VRDPKPRIIHAPAYRDRVVHHALMRVVGPVWDRRFVHHNYACRIGRGLHRAAEACQRFARRRRWALRMDVRRFYESVDHEVLLRKATICSLRF
jgi:retron-type reverse transcriptase